MGEYSIVVFMTLLGVIVVGATTYKVLKVSEELSREIDSIKKDIEYISDEMKLDKMARQELYKNSSRSKENLETMDIMKEVVLQNVKLNEEMPVLKVQNHELTKIKSNSGREKLLNVLNRCDQSLSELKGRRNPEEIQRVLGEIKKELSEYV